MNEQTVEAILFIFLAVSEFMALNSKLKDNGILQLLIRLLRGTTKR